MPAGPYPTKALFKNLEAKIVGPQLLTDWMGNPIGYTDPYGLDAGGEVYQVAYTNSNLVNATVKRLEISWYGENKVIDGLTLQTESLTKEDIEFIEFLPYKSFSQAPMQTLPDFQNISGARLDVMQWGPGTELPAHLKNLLLSTQYGSNTIIGFGRDSGSNIAYSGRVRISFTGEGTNKLVLRDPNSYPPEISPASTRGILYDNAGNEINAHPSFSMLSATGIETGYVKAFLPSTSMPVVSVPTQHGGGQGWELVWPLDGDPYIHAFRGSSDGTTNLHYHVKLTNGLPQTGAANVP